MSQETYKGILACILRPTPTLIVWSGPTAHDYVEIEIGDFLVIIDDHVFGTPETVFSGTITAMNTQACLRVPDGFGESIILLIRKGVIKFPAMLVRDTGYSWLANLFSQE